MQQPLSVQVAERLAYLASHAGDFGDRARLVRRPLAVLTPLAPRAHIPDAPVGQHTVVLQLKQTGMVQRGQQPQLGRGGPQAHDRHDLAAYDLPYLALAVVGQLANRLVAEGGDP